MPLRRCQSNGKSGWAWGNQKCYVGEDAKRKAAIQGYIISRQEKSDAHVDERMVRDVIEKRMEVELSSETLSKPIQKFADKLIQILADGGEIENETLSYEDLVVAGEKMTSLLVERVGGGYKAKGSSMIYFGKDAKRKAYLSQYAIDNAEKMISEKSAASDLKANLFMSRIASQLAGEALSDDYRDFADSLILAEFIVAGGIPLAPKKRKWDAAAARKRLAKWAGGPSKKTIDWKKYAKAFLIKQGDGKTYGSYKCPYCDVVNGKLMVVYDAVKAAYSVLKGGRGGVDGTGTKAALSKCKKLLKAFGDK